MAVKTVSTTQRAGLRSGGTGTMAGAKDNRYSKVSWVTAFFMTLFHIGAVWAIIDFTWSGVVVLLVTY